MKPEKDFGKVSDWITTIDDLEGKKLNPLILDESWWRNSYDSFTGLTGVSPTFIVRNFKKGDHDYAPVRELLYQSNPKTTFPVLSWDKSVVNEMMRI